MKPEQIETKALVEWARSQSENGWDWVTGRHYVKMFDDTADRLIELNEQLEHALNPVHSCGANCQRESCKLRRENEELKKDQLRLDFLRTSDVWFAIPSDGNWTAESFRKAIDAEMEETK